MQLLQQNNERRSCRRISNPDRRHRPHLGGPCGHGMPFRHLLRLLQHHPAGHLPGRGGCTEARGPARHARRGPRPHIPARPTNDRRELFRHLGRRHRHRHDRGLPGRGRGAGPRLWAAGGHVPGDGGRARGAGGAADPGAGHDPRGLLPRLLLAGPRHPLLLHPEPHHLPALPLLHRGRGRHDLRDHRPRRRPPPLHEAADQAARHGSRAAGRLPLPRRIRPRRGRVVQLPALALGDAAAGHHVGVPVPADPVHGQVHQRQGVHGAAVAGPHLRRLLGLHQPHDLLPERHDRRGYGAGSAARQLVGAAPARHAAHAHHRAQAVGLARRVVAAGAGRYRAAGAAPRLRVARGLHEVGLGVAGLLRPPLRWLRHRPADRHPRLGADAAGAAGLALPRALHSRPLPARRVEAGAAQ
mmetsp:Transcript_67402/g.180011  ORF Transcript_67402/g.180011 Transcript_67402/m.180011 type:complete len:413 (-) Transcript_67402:150-1388(-)